MALLLIARSIKRAHSNVTNLSNKASIAILSKSPLCSTDVKMSELALALPSQKTIGREVRLPKEEHDAMHDPLPPGETEHPHSFIFHPVKRVVQDPSSDIAGILVSASSWGKSF